MVHALVYCLFMPTLLNEQNEFEFWHHAFFLKCPMWKFCWMTFWEYCRKKIYQDKGDISSISSNSSSASSFSSNSSSASYFSSNSSSASSFSSNSSSYSSSNNQFLPSSTVMFLLFRPVIYYISYHMLYMKSYIT